MRRTQPGTAIFILTSYPAFESALQAIRQQVDDYFVKPANVDAVVSRIVTRLSEPPTVRSGIGRLAVENTSRWGPDLFLSDVSMPEPGGTQAAIEICTMFSGCRFLLFSGEPSSKILVREAGEKGHRFEFLDKPIPPVDLLRRIRYLRAA